LITLQKIAIKVLGSVVVQLYTGECKK